MLWLMICDDLVCQPHALNSIRQRSRDLLLRYLRHKHFLVFLSRPKLDFLHILAHAAGAAQASPLASRLHNHAFAHALGSGPI